MYEVSNVARNREGSDSNEFDLGSKSSVERKSHVVCLMYVSFFQSASKTLQMKYLPGQ